MSASSSAAIPPSQTSLAFDDLRDGLRKPDLWLMLGWQDIRRRYRRSALGPFWLTLSMGAMIGGIGVVNSGLFGVAMGELLPSMSLGIVLWSLISTCITEGCAAFTGSEPLIRQSRQPFTVYLMRALWRNLIIFAHNMVIALIVLAIWPPQNWWLVPLALIGLVLLLLNVGWMMLLAGVICTRFRDLPQIVASVLQIMFFVTPIFWLPTQLKGLRAIIVEFNPIYHMLELVRAPLLGTPVPLISWIWTFGMLFLGWWLAMAFFIRFRRRLPYWL